MNLKKVSQFPLLACCLLVSLKSFSQPSLGVHATLGEYAGDLNHDHYHFYNFQNPQVGAAISFQQYLNPSFNLVQKISFNQVQYQNPDKTAGVDADLFALN